MESPNNGSVRLAGSAERSEESVQRFKKAPDGRVVVHPRGNGHAHLDNLLAVARPQAQDLVLHLLLWAKSSMGLEIGGGPVAC